MVERDLHSSRSRKFLLRIFNYWTALISVVALALALFIAFLTDSKVVKNELADNVILKLNGEWNLVLDEFLRIVF